MKLLAIDSSAKVASAAVCTEDKVIAQTTLNTGLTHSQTLMPICAGLLQHSGLSLAEIDGFAIAAGPGSFTGLRIGMAAVKGMALAEEKPCYPVSTLEALARNLIGFEGIVCAVMDARRGQVYNALFHIAEKGVERLCEDRAISIDSLAKELEVYSQSIWLCGDGADLTAGGLPQELKQVRLAPFALRYQTASGVASAAFADGRPVSAKELSPQYLRLPQAERERLERLAQADK